MRDVFGYGYVVCYQAPLHISNASLPEPDVSVVPGAIRDYSTQHPTTARLVVEVSDATIDFDADTKSAIYAAAGIPEYWIVAIAERVLIVYREPDLAARAYRSVVRLRSRDSVSPLEAPSAVTWIAALLP